MNRYIQIGGRSKESLTRVPDSGYAVVTFSFERYFTTSHVQISTLFLHVPWVPKYMLKWCTEQPRGVHKWVIHLCMPLMCTGKWWRIRMLHRNIFQQECITSRMQTAGFLPYGRGGSVWGASVWRRGVSAWGSLCPGVSVQGGLCPGIFVQGSLSRGFLSRGVSVQGVSVQEGQCPGSLCPGGSPWQRPPPPETEWHTGVKTLPCHNFVAGGKNTQNERNLNPHERVHGQPAYSIC